MFRSAPPHSIASLQHAPALFRPRPQAIAYRAFSACSVMQLTERALKAIIERHPVLRDKLKAALKEAIQRQTASDDVLTNQVHRLQKKNSLFHALQTNLMNSEKRGNLAKALDRGHTVKKVMEDADAEAMKEGDEEEEDEEEEEEAEGIEAVSRKAILRLIPKSPRPRGVG